MKCEKILPLNKSIVSKIEKISQDMQRTNNIGFNFVPPSENSTFEKSTVDPGKFLTNNSMTVQKEISQLSQTVSSNTTPQSLEFQAAIARVAHPSNSNGIIDGGQLLKSIQKMTRPGMYFKIFFLSYL